MYVCATLVVPVGVHVLVYSSMRESKSNKKGFRIVFASSCSEKHKWRSLSTYSILEKNATDFDSRKRLNGSQTNFHNVKRVKSQFCVTCSSLHATIFFSIRRRHRYICSIHYVSFILFLVLSGNTKTNLTWNTFFRLFFLLFFLSCEVRHKSIQKGINADDKKWLWKKKDSSTITIVIIIIYLNGISCVRRANVFNVHSHEEIFPLFVYLFFDNFQGIIWSKIFSFECR